MMRKKTNYTSVTPIPSHIPRKLAVELLHSHGEIITLNPLVLDFRAVKAPRDAPSDEYYSTWYEIDQRIQFIPGAGNMGSGKISFKGCFHDMDYGIQTHMYAPMKVDLRNKWRIAGSQPGEAREIPEIGIGAPSEGLYLREDVEIKCNITMASFVKKEMKAASKILVDRLIKKAELLDAGVLQAMMEDGKLKTFNPADRSNLIPSRTSTINSGSPGQHSSMYAAPQSPGLQYQQYQSPPPGHPAYSQPAMFNAQVQQQHYKYANIQSQQGLPMELPGDYYHPSPNSPGYLQPDWKRQSHTSELSGNSPVATTGGRWSASGSEYNRDSHYSSRPTSYTTDTSGVRSPKPDQQSFGSDLSGVRETKEEYDSRQNALKVLESGQQVPQSHGYNPEAYANTH